jgi:hypothetical protein
MATRPFGRESRSACKRASCSAERWKTSGRFGRSSFFRGLPATAGSLRRFQPDSRAGSARDEKKPAVVMSNTYADLQDFYGSDGTRTPTSGVTSVTKVFHPASPNRRNRGAMPVREYSTSFRFDRLSPDFTRSFPARFQGAARSRGILSVMTMTLPPLPTENRDRQHYAPAVACAADGTRSMLVGQTQRRWSV